jgi:hypothetical protein
MEYKCDGNAWEFYLYFTWQKNMLEIILQNDLMWIKIKSEAESAIYVMLHNKMSTCY